MILVFTLHAVSNTLIKISSKQKVKKNFFRQIWRSNKINLFLPESTIRRLICSDNLNTKWRVQDPAQRSKVTRNRQRSFYRKKSGFMFGVFWISRHKRYVHSRTCVQQGRRKVWISLGARTYLLVYKVFRRNSLNGKTWGCTCTSSSS